MSSNPDSTAGPLTRKPLMTPAEWRQAVEESNEEARFPGSDAVLNFMIWAYSEPPEYTKHPASVSTFRRCRKAFSSRAYYEFPVCTHTEIKAIVGQLCARGLAAPWWIVTDAQASFTRRGR